MSKLSPTERTLRAKLAAHESWANTTDRTARTAKPRAAAAWKRFLEQADGDPVRAEHLRQAHAARVELNAATARRKAAEAALASEAAEAALRAAGGVL